MACLRSWLARLLPIALGHLAAMAPVAAAVVLGWSPDRGILQAVAGGLLAAMLACRLWGRAARQMRASAGHGALALGSFLVASAHGAGLVLVPALAPLCLSNAAVGDTDWAGALAPALAGIVVHTAAMLAVSGVIAAGLRRVPSLLRSGGHSPAAATAAARARPASPAG